MISLQFVLTGGVACANACVIGVARWGRGWADELFVLPPEINSLRMFTGAGSAPMLAASVAWDGLAAELAVAASSFGSVTSGLAGQSWQGAAAA
ncbi:hypothetical protein IQ44_02420, partial [Mycobacterium tuberculosis]